MDQGVVDEKTSAHERLVGELRRIKDESRLSFGRLAAATNYSSSSWERFLNGKQLPSRVAVEELAVVGGEDPERLIALWEEAVGQPSEAAPGTVDSADDQPEPPADIPADIPAARPRAVRVRRAARRMAAVGYLTAGVLLGSLLTALLITGGQSGAAPAAKESAQADQVARQKNPGCSGDTCLSREPQAMDCQWDAGTVRQTWLRGLQIQLRYSPVCQAVWGRIENGTVGDEVTIKDRGGRTEESRIRVGTDTYTRMLAVTPGAPATSVTICGMIASQHEMECSPTAPVQP